MKSIGGMGNPLTPPCSAFRRMSSTKLLQMERTFEACWAAISALFLCAEQLHQICSSWSQSRQSVSGEFCSCTVRIQYLHLTRIVTHFLSYLSISSPQCFNFTELMKVLFFYIPPLFPIPQCTPSKTSIWTCTLSDFRRYSLFTPGLPRQFWPLVSQSHSL